MANRTVATAPGSTMITGEHAVVYGHPCLVCALDQRIEVAVTALDRREVSINSEIASPVRVPLDDFEASGPMRFVLSAIEVYRYHLQHGLRIDIKSAINPTLGLGSSAAVTVAILGALNHMTQSGNDLETLHGQALGIIRHHQGRGSGADLAASFFGGLVSYQLSPDALAGMPKSGGDHAMISSLPQPPFLSLAYCGYKTPTGEVLARIAKAMEGNEAKFEALYDKMGQLAVSTIDVARSENWTAFGAALNQYQKFMVELGVSDEALDRLVEEAWQHETVIGAKISGSGLGDCVVAVGGTPPSYTPAPFSRDGLIVHDE